MKNVTPRAVTSKPCTGPAVQGKPIHKASELHLQFWDGLTSTAHKIAESIASFDGMSRRRTHHRKESLTMNELCICLTYIGDNGPCPIHGNPPTVDEEKELKIDLAPRVLKVFTNEQLLAMTARRMGVQIEINPHKGE